MASGNLRSEQREIAPETKIWLKTQARVARRFVARSALFGWFEGVLVIVQALCIATIVHGAFLDGQGFDSLSLWLSAIPVCVIARALLAWAREDVGAKAGIAVQAEVHDKLAKHLFELGPVQVERRSASQIAATASEHIQGLHDYGAKFLPQRVIAGLVPISILVAILPFSWFGAVILGLTAPVIPFFAWLIGLGAARASQSQYQALSRLSSLFLDRLRGLPTLKVFDRTDQELENIKKSSENYRKRTMKVLRIAFLTSGVLELFAALGVGIMAVYLGFALYGSWNIGFWGAEPSFRWALFMLILAAEFYLPFRTLGNLHHARSEALGAADQLRKIFEIRPVELEKTQASTEKHEFDDGPISIEFDNVHLTFEGTERSVLDGLSLSVEQGEHIALIGTSGEGKTTFLNVLMGLIRPDQGRVLINGRDLRSYELRKWHEKISWVGQGPLLFHGTIRSNIALGRPDASDEEIEEAARAARVREFTRDLPEGLDSKVFELGLGFSGGQIQRIALARAYLRKTPVLLLDEPTANLDAESERAVIEALESVSRERTLILVSHRAAPLRFVDRVLNLEKGRLSEANNSRGGGHA